MKKLLNCDESDEVTAEDFVDICLVINYFYMDDFYKSQMTSFALTRLYGISFDLLEKVDKLGFPYPS